MKAENLIGDLCTGSGKTPPRFYNNQGVFFSYDSGSDHAVLSHGHPKIPPSFLPQERYRALYSGNDFLPAPVRHWLPALPGYQESILRKRSM